MKDLLFGWFFKPKYLQTGVDGVMFLIEFILFWIIVFAIILFIGMLLDLKNKLKWKNESKRKGVR